MRGMMTSLLFWTPQGVARQTGAADRGTAMAYIPPQQRQPRPPGAGLHPTVKRLLIMALTLVAIPVVAYVLFLAAVLIISIVAGPIKWN